LGSTARRLQPQNGEKKGSPQDTIIVQSLSTRICLGVFAGMLEHCADALDAVLCAFAANAVATGNTLTCTEDSLDTEELIAVVSAYEADDAWTGGWPGARQQLPI
jgi:hypothetical protein